MAARFEIPAEEELQPSWDEDVENLLPSRHGHAGETVRRLGKVDTVAAVRAEAARLDFERRLDQYASDPLRAWVLYIEDLKEKVYPAGNVAIDHVTRACFEAFREEPRYTGDKRFLNVCIEHAKTSGNAREVLDFMQHHGVCVSLPRFHLAVATVAEEHGDLAKADEAYTTATGLARELKRDAVERGRPKSAVDKLSEEVRWILELHSHFQRRRAKKLAAAGTQTARALHGPTVRASPATAARPFAVQSQQQQQRPAPQTQARPFAVFGAEPAPVSSVARPNFSAQASAVRPARRVEFGGFHAAASRPTPARAAPAPSLLETTAQSEWQSLMRGPGENVAPTTTWAAAGPLASSSQAGILRAPTTASRGRGAGAPFPVYPDAVETAATTVTSETASTAARPSPATQRRRREEEERALAASLGQLRLGATTPAAAPASRAAPESASSEQDYTINTRLAMDDMRVMFYGSPTVTSEARPAMATTARRPVLAGNRLAFQTPGAAPPRTANRRGLSERRVVREAPFTSAAPHLPRVYAEHPEIQNISPNVALTPGELSAVSARRASRATPSSSSSSRRRRPLSVAQSREDLASPSFRAFVAEPPSHAGERFAVFVDGPPASPQGAATGGFFSQDPDAAAAAPPAMTTIEPSRPAEAEHHQQQEEDDDYDDDGTYVGNRLSLFPQELEGTATFDIA